MAFTRSRVRSPSAPQIPTRDPSDLPFYVYILESHVDGSLYTGQTSHLCDRLTSHNKGWVQSTKAKRPYPLVYFEVFTTRSQAMWREWELKKKWNTDRKKRLIRTFDKSKITCLIGSSTNSSNP
ncbi:MAG TPA: GIY-YIG nuclease family protein [Candidatus Kryptonia bacterium]